MSRSAWSPIWLTIRLLIALLALGVGAVMLTAPAYAATITVTNATDDVTGGDGCSLREALLNARNNDTSGSAECTAGSGADTVEFNLQNGVNGVVGAGPYTISPTVPYSVEDGTTINGFSQPGASANSNNVSSGSNAVLMIEIDGTGAPSPCIEMNTPNVTVRGLVVNRCPVAEIGVYAADATIAGNYLGTNPTGTAVAPGNASFGILVSAVDVVVGGTAAADRNIVSGHGGREISIQTGGTGATIQGNYIGLNAAGTAALDLVTGRGINNVGLANMQVGGTNPEARNVIAGQTYGILIEHVGGAGAVVQGNYIGTNAAGTAALANGTGIWLTDSVPTATIGGTAAGAGNLISGSTDVGILVDGSATTGPTIQGNYIGTNAAGTAALANTVGIRTAGGVPGTTIGGTAAGAGNLISGNTNEGILIEGSATPGATIQGNKLGTNAAGTAGVPNNHGVNTINNGNNMTVGGVAAGAANIIAFNTSIGVRIAANSTGNTIRGNSIYSNGGLGIDLAPLGVEANDPDDPDTGANNYQNFPVLTSAAPAGGGTRVSVTLDSIASTAYTIDFYSNPSCDASGNGEGQTYLGTTTVNTDASGDGGLLVSGLAAVALGHAVTATATDPGGNTSEFSVCQTVASAAVSVTESGGTTATVEGGATDSLSLVLTAAPSSDVAVTLSSNVTSIVGFSPSTVFTFTTGNWNVAQVATVTSTDDQTVRASSHTISFAVSSGDAVYNGLSVTGITAGHTDNDTASVVVAPTSGLVTTESGATAQFNVRLTSIPTSAVTIGITSSNTAEGTVSPISLTFQADGTALVDQLVTITGVDDLVLDGDVGYTVQTAAASSVDAFYNLMNPSDVAVTNQDNEAATATPTITPTPTGTLPATLTPTATATTTPTAIATTTLTPTATPIPTTTSTVLPSSTPTLPPVKPSEDDTDKRARQTDQQRLNEEQTNAGNQDDVHTEGSVSSVDQSADGTSLLVTIALGPGGRETVLVEIPCVVTGGAAACPDVRAGDYLQADGYQNGVGDPNNHFVVTDDLTIIRDGRELR